MTDLKRRQSLSAAKPPPIVNMAFAKFPTRAREKLWTLRSLIFETAAELESVGPLTETLKWGQPAYLTGKPKTGTTIRLGMHDETAHTYALFVHCQTTLISEFRKRYKNELSFDKNRAIVFKPNAKLPKRVLRACIAEALTYHIR